jgi:hypothetical protein
MRVDGREPRVQRLAADGFATVNVAFLALDIGLAHATNGFRNPAELIPLIFSCLAPGILLLVMRNEGHSRLWRGIGLAVGGAAIVVGIAGLVWHLKSRFFYEQTLASLIYTAPFAAPLAYTGLGLLVILNRLVEPRSPEWPRWIVLLAAGGFVGNFIFSLADHAQNGFYYRTEWISVIAAALGLGFLVTPFVVTVDRAFLRVCALVMALEGLVGLVGFTLHALADLHGVSPHRLDNFIYGAPAMAPLLFPNLALLAILGLWCWQVQLEAAGPRREAI